MDSYKRFSDENYKHWLQAAESLHILRSHIREFVENETEKYHRSLRQKLKNEICASECSLQKCPPRPKKFPICEKCEKWKDAILNNHNNKHNDIHWKNCQPQLWPTDKWEVAKAYMIRGTKDHHSFDQFDISAILNFMTQCKHFKAFTEGKYLIQVITVRNKLMHSPDFTLSKKEMDDCINNVRELAKVLEKHAPGLKDVSKNIEEFSSILEKCSGQVSKSTADSKESRLKLLDREQAALKEKIELLAQCFEEDQDTELKLQEEMQGMKNFLDQNKDLLENLGPQVNRLKEIQEKVNKHEQDINKLSNRVDRLESDVPDQVFSCDVLKFKNHVFEEARRRNMPDPEFTEECEASGYRGIVKVNGRTFRGLEVCNNKRTAHQEVAKIALTYMHSHPEWKEETTETTSSVSSSTSSSSTVHYGVVTVFLDNQQVTSDWCAQNEEATESAYRKLASQFGLTPPKGNTFKTTVLENFKRCNFPSPLELPVHQDDKTLCKLQLSGSFTFYDKDGSSKKKQAEHQAAKIAVQNLSGIINCRSLANAGDNWIGFLKERVDALGLKQPEYDFLRKKVCISQETERPTTSEDSSHKVISKNDSLQAKNSVAVVQDLPTADTVNVVDCQEMKTLDSSPPEMPSQASGRDSTGTVFYGIVTVSLNNQEVVSDECVEEEEATESAYRKLACQFGMTSLEGKTAVLEHFKRCNFPTPRELSVREGDKIFCKLQLTGDFIFSDKVGASKKKLAERQAAKVALQHLSGLFNCSFEAEADKNYKSFLKERLDALHLENPVYRCKVKEGISEAEGPSTSGDNLHSSCTTAISKNFCLQPKDSISPQCDASLPEIPNKSPKMDNTAINTLLVLFNLKPPSVTVENVRTEKVFSCHVDINLENFTFQNKNEYIAKKDAIRKTYVLLGTALGISKSKLDENNASMLVKQDFSQKSLTLPKEVFEDNKCSITDITYSFVYDGKGSTEAEAKQDALQKALDMLTLLFGFKSLPKCRTVEETEVQINKLLTTKDQKDLIYSLKCNLYKSSVELLFKDYTMESTHEKKKKENINHLSKRILGLLAVEPEPNSVSLRNCLDEWFKRKNLEQPVFENTEEVHGSKVTFSVTVSCSNPNWESSMEVAEEKLVDELKKRLNYLTDEGKE
ncbi:uncharacterized protein si:ch211-91p5.3 isoform X2 [Neoarius graeffei]|uniref:uncharacterized protein si:ch211-91p5.3 isoform X2 n=1 Tax=Neoarius graeffei TaxID=443677 RepID=UPI00298CE5A7|nr:uncharacterized protein si:ch211-91p5.3 isoform X2 [Neoarius graeffei]